VTSVALSLQCCSDSSPPVQGAVVLVRSAALRFYSRAAPPKLRSGRVSGGGATGATVSLLLQELQLMGN